MSYQIQSWYFHYCNEWKRSIVNCIIIINKLSAIFDLMLEELLQINWEVERTLLYVKQRKVMSIADFKYKFSSVSSVLCLIIPANV